MCGIVVSWFGGRNDDGSYAYTVPMHVVEPTLACTITDKGGWVTCAHCGWAEVLEDERYRMAMLWPGVACPNCHGGQPSRLNFLRPGTQPWTPAPEPI